MSTRAPLAIVPRDLAAVPPPVSLVGRKAHALAQLLAMKARVPRFGIITVEGFDALCDSVEVRTTLRQWSDHPPHDAAARHVAAETLVKAAQRAALPVAVRIASSEIFQAFSDDDVLCVRASVVGEAVEARVLKGLLPPVLGIRGAEQLEDAIGKLYAAVFSAHVLEQRHLAGLSAVGARIAVVVQRLVNSETTGVCHTVVNTDAAGDEVWAHIVAHPGILCQAQAAPELNDTFRVARPDDAAAPLPEQAKVNATVVHKPTLWRTLEQQRVVEVPAPDTQADEPALSTVQARMVVKEALRLEHAFSKPLSVTFAYSNRLLHVLDVEPLHLPEARVESKRERRFDARLLPGNVHGTVDALSLSLWQGALGRGIERAWRILGAKGVRLEEQRPVLSRILCVVEGAPYVDTDSVHTLVELLPLADRARAALSALLDGIDLQKREPRPGTFWQRQKYKRDEGQRLQQLESHEATALIAHAHLTREVRASLQRAAETPFKDLDPDALLDWDDELTDALSKAVASTLLTGMFALMFQDELLSLLRDDALRISDTTLLDLLIPDPQAHTPPELFAGVRRMYALVEEIRQRPAASALLRTHAHDPRALAVKLGLVGNGKTADADTPDGRFVRTEVVHFCRGTFTSCSSLLTLSGTPLSDDPALVLSHLVRLLDTHASNAWLDRREQAAQERRRKAETQLDEAIKSLSPLRAAAMKKRVWPTLERVRRHLGLCARAFLDLELAIARLRDVHLTLGQRLFEHGLLDHPRDVLMLTHAESTGAVRGTAVDDDLRAVAAARRRGRRASAHHRSRVGALDTNDPTGAHDRERPTRVRTRGVVRAAVAEAIDAAANSQVVVHGDVTARFTTLDNTAQVNRVTVDGIIIADTLTLASLPLLCVADAVVAARATPFGPVAFALRAVGVCTLVGASPDLQLTSDRNARIAVHALKGTLGPAERAPVPVPIALPSMEQPPQTESKVSTQQPQRRSGVLVSQEGHATPPPASHRVATSLASRIMHAADAASIPSYEGSLAEVDAVSESDSALLPRIAAHAADDAGAEESTARDVTAHDEERLTGLSREADGFEDPRASQPQAVLSPSALHPILTDSMEETQVDAALPALAKQRSVDHSVDDEDIIDATDIGKAVTESEKSVASKKAQKRRPPASH